ncbi:MAG: hypothetical protein ACPG21_01220 [Crocinitomicaceae bacterium]
MKKEAYVINSLAQKMILNLYLTMRRTDFPVKAFDHIGKDMKWLELDKG